MPASGSKNFVQGYNCQAAVNEKAQIIIATNVTQDPNDKLQVKPLVEKIESNTEGQLPEKTSMDTGYFSESNCNYLQEKEIDAYVATEKLKHGEVPLAQRGRIPKNATVKERMARKATYFKGAINLQAPQTNC